MLKSKGLVSVHVGPNNKSLNISGPVAVIMDNDEYFLGAYTVGMDFLGFKLIPKKFIGTTAWPEHYPASKNLLDLLARTELSETDLLTAVPVGPRDQQVILEYPVETLNQKPKEETISDRRTEIVEVDLEAKNYLKLSQEIKGMKDDEEVKVGIMLQTNSNREIMTIQEQIQGLDPKAVLFPQLKKIVATLAVSEVKEISLRPYVMWVEVHRSGIVQRRSTEITPFGTESAIGLEKDEEEKPARKISPNHSMIVSKAPVDPLLAEVREKLAQTREKFEQIVH